MFSEIIIKNFSSEKIEIVGIIGRRSNKLNSDHVDLRMIANGIHVPFHSTNDINSSKTISWAKKLKPDWILCVGWSQLFKESILKIPKYKVIGYHPALLPANRGRHPLIWALFLGLDFTGSSFFIMNEKADSGKVILQKIIRINKNDNAQILYNKMIKTALSQVNELIKIFLSEGRNFNYINNNIKTNYWRKRDIQDGVIDWRMSSAQIVRLINALYKPYVGAQFEYKGKDIKVWKAKVIRIKQQNIEPGKIISYKNLKNIVKSGDTAVQLTIIEPAIKLKIGTYLK
jgi:methionyl-tRNA formyltransferase